MRGEQADRDARARRRPAASAAATGRCRRSPTCSAGRRRVSSQTRPLRRLRADRDVAGLAAAAPARRSSSRPATRGRPAAASRPAPGRSVSTRSARTPRITAGSPSSRNSHCQPRSPSDAVHAQQRFRHRRADDHRDRRRHHEQRIRAGALGRRNPVGEVEHHAGKEARLGDAQHDARDHERPSRR